MNSTLLASAGCVVPVLVIYWISRQFGSRAPRIPGPPALPLVGHTFQVPKKGKIWKFYEKLAHEYGPIVKLTLAGDDILVLSDAEDAQELLGRRSLIYSSRRPLIYAGKYQSNNQRLTLQPYGEKFRRQRTAFHQMLEPRAVGGYEALQLSTFYEHFPRFPASLVFTLSFDKPLPDDGKDLDEVQRVLADFVQDMNPGAHLVDTFPMLDLLPDFLSPWRAEARKKGARELELYGRLTMDTPDLECFAARVWEQQEKLGIDDEEVIYIAGSAFASGTGTSMANLLCRRKAQQEIDSVFSADTIPDFSRMKDLPYCFALIKEVIRWAPGAPLSFPHYLDVDDEYKGYHIRKGTTVISSLWNMHHNEAEFPNSYTFNPDRFLNKDLGVEGLGEGIYGFGFGPCPGQHMASRSQWIAIVRVLWAFNIAPAKDERGNPIPLDIDNCTEGLTSHPNEFFASFIPRSAAHVETIMSG
ncbi:cytochrome P450 [Mycena olivaceomarginata]|nr:cytochrome P450 [Mycena olivaceomarginata]